MPSFAAATSTAIGTCRFIDTRNFSRAYFKRPDAEVLCDMEEGDKECLACLLGLSIPSLLHALRLDPKIAAGPLTLALADILTLLFYLSIASLLLRPG